MNSTLAITIQGVATHLLGAYGADNARTPVIDRLASVSLLLDRCYVDSLDPLLQLRSVWTGRHALQDVAPQTWSVWRAAAEADCEATLITDCPQAAELAEELGCESVILVDIEAATRVVDDSLQSAAVSVFAAAADELLNCETPALLWVHSRGLRGAWDAPLELRERFIDPEDESPPEGFELPDLTVTSDTDPDLIVGWAQVAAAQTAVLDEALGLLLTALEARDDWQQWNVLLASLGGVPLGEHGHVGWAGQALRECQLACAMMLKPVGWPPVGVRRNGLCQLPDIALTIAELLGDAGQNPDAGQWRPPTDVWGRSVLSLRRSLKLSGQESETHAGAAHCQVLVQRDVPADRMDEGYSDAGHADAGYADAGYAGEDRESASESSLETWIRTPAWSACLRPDAAELYVMPDDRWEVSDLARRCEDVVDLLRECVDEFRKALAVSHRDALFVVDSELWSTMR